MRPVFAFIFVFLYVFVLDRQSWVGLPPQGLGQAPARKHEDVVGHPECCHNVTATQKVIMSQRHRVLQRCSNTERYNVLRTRLTQYAHLEICADALKRKGLPRRAQTGANVQSRMFGAEHCREASANVQRWKTLGTILLHFDSQLNRRATIPAKWQRFKIDSISVMKMRRFLLLFFLD